MKRQRKQGSGGEATIGNPKLSPKRTWHPLTLQQLHQNQFIDVVNGILSGKNELFQGSLKGASGIREGEDVLLATHRD